MAAPAKPSLLPRGRLLPVHEWRARHRVILTILWLHVPALLAFGTFMGASWQHVATEALLPTALAALASIRWAWTGGREYTVRATVAGAGLVACSAVLTHLSGGYIEMHFHFFVMIAVMAMYQDWVPFILAIAFTVTHHGVVGVLDPMSVYNHPAAWAHPWRWAGIHAAFVLAAAAAAVATWKHSEQARVRAEAALREAREAASLQRATLESTADGILVVDTQGRIASYNRQFARMWGIPESVLRTRDDTRAIQHVLEQLKDPAAFLAKVKELYAKPDAESHDVLHFADGRVFERYSKPQRIEGNFVGRVWSFRDVTERVRAEEERVRRQAEIQRLEAMDRFKTQLLNTASHELNTPLTPLRLQVEVLRQTGLAAMSERQKRSVDILDRNLSRLSGLVQNVLDVARLQADRLELQARPTSLRTLVEETVESFSETAAAQNAMLEIDPTSDDVVLPVDGPRVTQVLYNLVSNALKFTPAAGSIVVRVRRTQQGGRVEVKDTGRGLTPAEIDLLFQPFSQVHGSDGPGGTGLGLYISRGIIEHHSGTVGANSEGLGKGATFWFELPRAGPAPAGREAHGATTAGAEGTPLAPTRDRRPAEV